MKDRVLIFPILFIMVFLSSPARGQDAKAPEISFKEKTYSAGEVIEGAVIEHTYTVYNKGSEVLKIYKVSPG